MADRITDYARSPSSEAVADTPSTSGGDYRLGRLESRIDEISHQQSSLAPLLHRRRRASRDRRGKMDVPDFQARRQVDLY
ncbi:hypothetical protein HPB48_003324 [Haemaphysalis longicornis]|uniref:Uncharacterized protein n=1 Tax=Haemaphysalis longicornis TaxID=44386 RepID=A0A9J6GAJ7_HAELO|nr:hypothetical protein HPB48_003324 [Haemaphysalis longicornis]